MIVTIGKGAKAPQGMRIEAGGDLVAFLRSLPPEVESWWTGHTWANDYRDKAQWQGSSVLVLDVDHHGTSTDPKRRHTSPPDDRRAAVEVAGLEQCCTLWHHTPRGLRAVFALGATCTDAKLLDRAQRGAAAVVSKALRAVGVHARRDRGGRPIDGYAPDTATFDLARLMYCPHAIVGGAPRPWPVMPGVAKLYDVEALAGMASASTSPPTPAETLEEDAVRTALARMPCEGNGDGSAELIRVCARAISLKVPREGIVSALATWNGQRAEPWVDEAILTRYDDSAARWEEQGLAKVPLGKYARAALDDVITSDRAYAGRFSWDELEERVVYTLEDGVPSPLDEVMVTGIETAICRRYAWPAIPREALRQSIVAQAHRQIRNRVVDYLTALPPWDGQERSGDLAGALHVVHEQRHMGRVYLRKMMIAACARAIEPGCKVDTMMVLVGHEGIGKSTFFREIFGAENFNDTKPDLESKDAYIQVQAAWCYEWGELEAITRRADVARIKNFLSSQADSYRAPYEREVRRHPRRGVIVGSSNSHDLILDLDSDRRYWIVELERRRADRAWLTAHRDQLWAEALEAYAAGEEWFLSVEEEENRRDLNELFRPDDPMIERIGAIITELAAKADAAEGVRSADLFTKLGIDPHSNNRAIFSTVNATLRRLGFARKRLRKGPQYVTCYVREKMRHLTIAESDDSEG